MNATTRYNDSARHSPLGILQLMAVVDREMPWVKQQLYDQNAWRVDNIQENKLPGLDEALKAEDWDVVLFGSLITGYNYIKASILRTRELLGDVPIITGGGFFSCLPTEMMTWLPIDVGVIGEAYQTLPQVLLSIKQNEFNNMDHIDGIVYRKNGLKFTAPRDLIPDLDWLPYPAYHYAPLEIYFRNTSILMSEEAMFARKRLDCEYSSGCSFQCHFCYDLSISDKQEYVSGPENKTWIRMGRPPRPVIRYHSPKYIVDRMEWMRKNPIFLNVEYELESGVWVGKGYPPDFIAVIDENLQTSIRRNEKERWWNRIVGLMWARDLICDCIREKREHDTNKDTGLHQGSTGHAGLVTPHSLKLQRLGGMSYLDFGLESWDEDIMQHLGKGSTPRRNGQAIEMTMESGIRCIDPNSVILTAEGLPKKLKDTHSLVKSLDLKNGLMSDAFAWHIEKAIPEQVLKIVTRNSELVCTPYHKLFVFDNGDWQERKAKDVKIHDLLMTVSDYPEPRNASRIGRHLAYFIGAFIGDGTSNKGINKHGSPTYKVDISTGDGEIVERCSIFLRQQGYTANVLTADTGSYFTVLGGKRTYKTLQRFQLASIHSPNRILCDKLLRLRNLEMVELLRGLFDTDGSVDGSAVRLSMTSRELITQIKYVLLRFGIHSGRVLEHGRPDERTMWTILVNSKEGLSRFANEIGFSVIRKQVRLEARLKSIKGISKDSIYVPLDPSLLKQFRGSFKYGELYRALDSVGIPRYFVEGKNRYGRIRENELRKLASIAPNELRERFNSVLRSKIRCVLVTRIEPCDDISVSDLYVPPNHTYIAEGLVIHNCIPNQIVGFKLETWASIRKMMAAWEKYSIMNSPFINTPYPGSQDFIDNYDKILYQYNGSLESFIKDLEDATKVTATISDNFTGVELAGIREMMVQRNYRQLAIYERQWRKVRGLPEDGGEFAKYLEKNI